MINVFVENGSSVSCNDFRFRIFFFIYICQTFEIDDNWVYFSVTFTDIQIIFEIMQLVFNVLKIYSHYKQSLYTVFKFPSTLFVLFSPQSNIGGNI